MTTSTTSTRDTLMDIRARLSSCYADVDDLAPRLDSPEREALLSIRDDLARHVRALGNIAALLGTVGPER